MERVWPLDGPSWSGWSIIRWSSMLCRGFNEGGNLSSVDVLVIMQGLMLGQSVAGHHDRSDPMRDVLHTIFSDTLYVFRDLIDQTIRDVYNSPRMSNWGSAPPHPRLPHIWCSPVSASE